MNLKVMMPTHVDIDEEVSGITVEASDGLQPLTADDYNFISSLPAGILHYQTLDGKERHVVVNNGMLVKVNQEVTLSVYNAGF